MTGVFGISQRSGRGLIRPSVLAPLFGLGLGLTLMACQPTVKVEAPKEPITINLNIKLEADVRVRLEDQAREDVSSNPIF